MLAVHLPAHHMPLLVVWELVSLDRKEAEVVDAIVVDAQAQGTVFVGLAAGPVE